MSEAYELGLFVCCLFGSAFYSGSEAALISISIDRAQQLLEEGGKRGQAMEILIKEPTTVLTTILVGNNLVNVLAASLITVITQRYFASDAIAISTGITTFLILIFGEIMPKTFFRKHAESFAYLIIKILQINYYLLFPVIKTVTWIINTVLGKNAIIRGKIITKDDIEYMVNKAEQEKTIDSKQIDLLTSILEFPTIKVKDIMIPRKEVQSVHKGKSFSEIINTIRKQGHSRYPVYDEDMDDIKGILHVKDLAFVTSKELEDFKVERYLKQPFFVYEHMKIQAVFDHMKKKKVHLALVKDENGLVVGIITLEDIIEEILGEIQDEHDKEEADEIPEDQVDLVEGIVIDGSYSLRDLYNDFDIKIPLNDNYSTLAGFLLDMLGNNFPESGQMIFWEGYSFKLDNVEDQEIKDVRITQVDGDHIAPTSPEDTAESTSDNDASGK